MAKSIKKQPKYQTIKEYVTSRISTGEYGANTRIPSENEFAQILDVSSITIRKALSELVNEGYIYRVKGKGSFVADSQKKQSAGSSDLVAFLITTVNIHDASIMQIIMGIQKKLSESGYSLIVENLMNYINNEKMVIDRLVDNKVMGFIVFPEPATMDYVNYLGGLNVPFVVLDRHPKGQLVNFVGCNNHDGAVLGAQHLIGLGHRSIGFVAYSFDLSSEKERFEGYADAMRNAGLTVDDELLFLESPVPWERLAGLVRDGKMTAIFCVNDMQAHQAIESLTALGVRIPEDLSVMGFDDAEFASHGAIPISTVRQSFFDMGYTGGRLLLDILQSNQNQFTHILLGTKLVLRKSTARPQK